MDHSRIGQADSETRGVADFANHEIVTLAAFLLGGASKPIDTEDIAIKADSICPGRFSWRKHPEQISLDAVRKRLWDAQSKDRDFEYVTGSERKGWMLSPRGLAFATQAAQSLPEGGTVARRMSRDEQRMRSQERVRLLESSASQKYLAGKADDISLREAEQFFRVDAYVTGKPRRQKVDRLANILGNDEVLGPIIEHVAEILSRG